MKTKRWTWRRYAKFGTTPYGVIRRPREPRPGERIRIRERCGDHGAKLISVRVDRVTAEAVFLSR